jgi:hypothetical protein
MNTSMSTLSAALEAFREFTGDRDVQVRAIQIFLKMVLMARPLTSMISQGLQE